jgi:hypothetical protein
MPLTRTQVARRLGKSVATVRRLEGCVLFPSLDWRGVHRFDDWEVEQLRENPERAHGYARSEWFESRQRRARKQRTTHRTDAPRRGQTAPASRIHGPSNTDVLARVLELLVERLTAVPARFLVRAGINDEFFEHILETLELVREPSH